jgi:hypothetical protein
MTTTEAKEKARTDAIRRKAARRGHKVIKGRRRGAGFMLLDDRRACVLGSWHDAALDQIDSYLDQVSAAK